MEIVLAGIPFFSGEWTEGVEFAPQALRRAGLLHAIEADRHELRDYGDFEIPPWISDWSDPRLKHLQPTLDALRVILKRMQDLVEANRFMLILGGDCPIILGTLGSIISTMPEDIGLFYFDAHGDFNTLETTPSGFIGGMCLASACGRGPPALTDLAKRSPLVEEDRVALVGSRAFRPLEARN